MYTHNKGFKEGFDSFMEGLECLTEMSLSDRSDGKEGLKKIWE